MNEEVNRHLAAMNAAWQRYARAIEQQLDTVPTDALSRDFVVAREGLAACGVLEGMLVYDPARMTFSLPTMIEIADDDMTAEAFPVPTSPPADVQSGDDDSGIGKSQLI